MGDSFKKLFTTSKIMYWSNEFAPLWHETVYDLITNYLNKWPVFLNADKSVFRVFFIFLKIRFPFISTPFLQLNVELDPVPSISISVYVKFLKQITKCFPCSLLKYICAFHLKYSDIHNLKYSDSFRYNWQRWFVDDEIKYHLFLYFRR